MDFHVFYMMSECWFSYDFAWFPVTSYDSQQFSIFLFWSVYFSCAFFLLYDSFSKLLSMRSVGSKNVLILDKWLFLNTIGPGSCVWLFFLEQNFEVSNRDQNQPKITTILVTKYTLAMERNYFKSYSSIYWYWMSQYEINYFFCKITCFICIFDWYYKFIIRI